MACWDLNRGLPTLQADMLPSELSRLDKNIELGEPSSSKRKSLRNENRMWEIEREREREREREIEKVKIKYRFSSKCTTQLNAT